jgi:hypothetical protein
LLFFDLKIKAKTTLDTNSEGQVYLQIDFSKEPVSPPVTISTPNPEQVTTPEQSSTWTLEAPKLGEPPKEWEVSFIKNPTTSIDLSGQGTNGQDPEATHYLKILGYASGAFNVELNDGTTGVKLNQGSLIPLSRKRLTNGDTLFLPALKPKVQLRVAIEDKKLVLTLHPLSTWAGGQSSGQ